MHLRFAEPERPPGEMKLLASRPQLSMHSRQMWQIVSQGFAFGGIGNLLTANGLAGTTGGSIRILWRRQH
jgi:hypothetical protein